MQPNQDHELEIRLRNQMDLARRVEDDAVASIAGLEQEVARQNAVIEEARRDREVFQNALDRILRRHPGSSTVAAPKNAEVPPPEASGAKENSEPEPAPSDSKGSEPNDEDTGVSSRKIVNVAVDMLRTDKDMAFSDVASRVRTVLGSDLPPSTIRSALERSDLIDRPRRGYYRLK